MTNLMASAISAAFLSFEETLTHIPKTRTTAKGHTREVEGDPVSFSGVLFEAKRFERMFSDGGFSSRTTRVLLLYPGSKDLEGEALSVDVNDAILDPAGVQFFVLSRTDETSRFGVLLYELGEERV